MNLEKIHGYGRGLKAVRYHRVAAQKPDALKQAEVKRLIKDSYETVKEKPPEKAQARPG